MMPTEHFKSKEAYRKWTAYRHIHGIPAPNLKTAVVAGKPHKVEHSALSRSKSRRKHHGKRSSK
jgi:hypothetical protein